MCTTHRLDVSMIRQPQGRGTSPKAHLPAWHIHVHMALLSLSRNDINRRGEEPPRKLIDLVCVCCVLTEQLSSLLCLLVHHAASEAKRHHVAASSSKSQPRARRICVLLCGAAC